MLSKAWQLGLGVVQLSSVIATSQPRENQETTSLSWQKEEFYCSQFQDRNIWGNKNKKRLVGVFIILQAKSPQGFLSRTGSIQDQPYYKEEKTDQLGISNSFHNLQTQKSHSILADQVLRSQKNYIFAQEQSPNLPCLRWKAAAALCQSGEKSRPQSSAQHGMHSFTPPEHKLFPGDYRVHPRNASLGPWTEMKLMGGTKHSGSRARSKWHGSVTFPAPAGPTKG